MANIFKLTKDYVNPPKRNSYDLSYQNDFTAKFGTLYPIFIKEVNPGDSFSIQTNLGIRAEPMVFPVQSKIRADVHYFYVRNRTLWEGWMDFIGKVDDTIEHPYIEQPSSFFKSKTLADYLGVPTSIVGGFNVNLAFPSNPYAWNGKRYYPSRSVTSVSFNEVTPSILSDISISTKPPSRVFNDINNEGAYVSMIPTTFYFENGSSLPPFPYYVYQGNTLNTSATLDGYSFLSPILSVSDYIDFFKSDDCLMAIHNPINNIGNTSFTYDRLKITIFYSTSNNAYVSTFIPITSNHFSSAISFENSFTTINFGYTNGQDAILTFLREIEILGGKEVFLMFTLPASYSTTTTAGQVSFSFDGNAAYDSDDYFSFGNLFEFVGLIRDLSYDSSELASKTLPWVNNNQRVRPIKLSALPFRAYEAIYNSYYRNYMNNPFILNGKPQYNRYVTNLGDGADTTPYKLFNRNWELDFLTSAQHSPQQGEAPLVGITINPNSTATMKFKSTELESAGIANGEVTATVEIDENTNVLGISYYDEQLPQSNLKRLMEAINFGISINDLRQTTALQRWLEKNILKGYRYIDQIKAHFAVDVSYRDLLMPEFIGGHSQAINTLTISQTTPTGDSPLGSYGGQAISKSSSENTVTKYCDEAGFIIGIMSIVPTPVYSQVPQQFFYKTNVLDYYFPEFGSIGMQPIFNKDITPLQTDENKLDDVFGYQRPWWHLISSIDEVHGEFRTNRQGYLIQRLFEETPVLNGDFLTINNDSINNVFYVDDEQSDQFLCQAYFKVTKKTAIPLFGMPCMDNRDVVYSH